MINFLKQYKHLVLLAVSLPFAAGCGGSIGLAAITDFLFGGGGGFFGGGGVIPGGGGGGLVLIHGPEPASMLLMGTGLAAMTYYKTKKSKKVK